MRRQPSSLRNNRPTLFHSLQSLVANGASHFLWLGGCSAASPPIEEVGPAAVFEAASDGGYGVGSRFRPTASRLFESVPDDALAGAFHDAGSDRQAALPAGIAAHSVPVGPVGADAGRDGFGPSRASDCMQSENPIARFLSGAANGRNSAVHTNRSPSPICSRRGQEHPSIRPLPDRTRRFKAGTSVALGPEFPLGP